MKMLPSSLLYLILMALPSLSTASPQPALVSDEYTHLMPYHTVFLRRQTSSNLQTFTGNLGGVSADAITNSGNSQRPFEVAGDTFTDFETAGELFSYRN